MDLWRQSPGGLYLIRFSHHHPAPFLFLHHVQSPDPTSQCFRTRFVGSKGVLLFFFFHAVPFFWVFTISTNNDYISKRVIRCKVFTLLNQTHAFKYFKLLQSLCLKARAGSKKIPKRSWLENFKS